MVFVLACAMSVGAPVLAGAASGGTAADAITDCNDHGKLTQQYSSEVLREALAQMPADVREYTDCFDVIERQLLAQAGTSAANTTTTAAGSGSSVLPTWLIVVIVLLALAAITFGALALRRRGEADEAGGPEGAPPDEPPTEPGDSEGPGDAGGPPAT